MTVTPGRLSVIGAGFGRTGTLSLKAALEKLGFDPCYHMLELRSHPTHAERWSAAADGADIDWDDLFGGYRAAVDWPACAFWRELSIQYPEAKLLLTLRDPERWYESVMNTIYQAMTRTPPVADARADAQLAMARKIVVEQTFEGRLDDRAHAIGVFERHCDEVQATIPADRLLVYQVSEGWGPLCAFLDRPLPEEPFPRTNSSEEFRQFAGLADSEE